MWLRLWRAAVFGAWPCLGSRLSRRAGGVPRALGLSFLVVGRFGLASQFRKSWVPPPESVRISTRRRAWRGTWARASLVTAMCSAAVFDPA